MVLYEDGPLAAVAVLTRDVASYFAGATIDLNGSAFAT